MSSEQVGKPIKKRWWHDRALLALVALFVALAPLVTHRIYASDEIQYFAYTHSLFFDGDLDFSNQYLHFYNSDPVKFKDIYEDLYLKHEPLTDLPLNVAPIGTGLMWMPSFAIAHLFASAAHALGFNVEATGYSGPYIFAICMTSYIFGCIALLLCYHIAKRLFGRRVSAIAVAVMWLATPLIFYTVIAPPWSHATSFLAVTLFLWYWMRTRRDEGRGLREWVILGALAGLMMLVREQDALFLVVPLIEGVAALASRWHDAPERLQRVRRWFVGLLAMGVAAGVVFIPQLVAYQVITGQLGPSKVVTGKFTWTSPNALNVLFSPEHGLIPWTPIIVLSLAGLVLLWQRDRVLTLALATAFLLQVYIAGSFLTWQSAGSFGQRRFINSTLIWVLGFAMLVSWAVSRGVPKWLIGGVAALFVAWNGGLLMQYALLCSPQRQGLDWATVLKGQLEIPFKATSLLWDYLTNRERFYRRTRC
ncbi:MAG TPA: glycosyltransferase family 39 protein [Chloroflexia bacterium]|nr:glycosyltransferase family 39 protein [Chloroflexia bacterium]